MVPPSFSSRSSSTIEREDMSTPYRDLGVEPIINCGASRSFYGNSAIDDDVAMAMHAASRNFVMMRELADAVGNRLAEVTGTPWGMVSAGTAGALALAAAACVAANNPLCMLRLPNIQGMADIVLIPKGHRFAYDQSIRLTGCRIVEFDGQADLEAALHSHRVAFLAVFGERMPQCPIPFETIVALCKPLHIPIVVDAASEFLVAPEPWIARGADLVAYSVGKVMRGPAAAGVLLGRKDLVQSAWFNGPPNQSFGRTAKISKEQMIGAVVAVEKWLKQDLAVLQQQWMERLQAIEHALEGTAHVRTTLLPAGPAIPRLKVEWEASVLNLDFEQLKSELLEVKPRILIDDFGGSEQSFVLNPFGLRDEEAAVVGAALKKAFEHRRMPPPSSSTTPTTLSGSWAVRLHFCNGTASHWLHIEQNGAAVSGVHGTPFDHGELTGTVNGKQFTLDAMHMVEANFVRFRYTGSIDENGTMAGRVLMGAAASHTKGPLTFGQFGEISWEAVRTES